MSIKSISNDYQINLNSGKPSAEIIYEFDGFCLDTREMMLYKGAETAPLTRKVVETLLVLVERRGEIVSKDELMRLLWTDSIVDEANLTQNIYVLRKTLGDAGNGQPYIETFRRRGYRFNGEIKKTGESRQFAATPSENGAAKDNQKAELTEFIFDDGNSSVEFEASAKRTNAAAPLLKFDQKNRNKSYFIFGAIAACALMLVAGFGWSRLGNRNGPAALAADSVAPSSQNITLKRLMPDVWAYNPALSPDGKRLAFVQIENGKRSIWLKELETGGSSQLTAPLVNGYASLVFSPDGAELYFSTLRPNVPNGVIVRLSVSGGAVREIVGNVVSPFAVSPDGQRIVYINGSRKLMIINADGSGERVLSDRESTGKVWFNVWSSQMSWSPDGTRIAVCGVFKENERNATELFEVSVADGSERRISTPPDWNWIDGAAWLPDGGGLLVTAREKENAPFQIWRVPYPNPNREAARVTNDLHSYGWIGLSADSSLLVAQQALGGVNLWAAPLAELKEAKQITSGNAAMDGYSGIALTSDGKIIYSSKRSGAIDLWTISADGSNQKQLTANAGDWNGNPVVTPDRQFIVFQSTRSGKHGIWRMDADGGNPRQLSGDSEALAPSLAPDGKWVYYTDHRAVWKIPIDGGAAERVSDDKLRSYISSVSPDGKMVLYAYTEENSPTPWKVGVMNAETGEQLKAFGVPHNRSILRWTADSKSFFHLDNSGALWEQPIDGDSPRRLTDFADAISNFAVSPDGKRIAFSRNKMSHEAVLITNFK